MSHIDELIKRFDMIAVPTEQLEKLTPGVPYPLPLVYSRLVRIGALVDCSLDDFRDMMSAEPGYTVDVDYLIRHDPLTGRTFFLLDPCMD